MVDSPPQQSFPALPALSTTASKESRPSAGKLFCCRRYLGINFVTIASSHSLIFPHSSADNVDHRELCEL